MIYRSLRTRHQDNRIQKRHGPLINQYLKFRILSPHKPQEFLEMKLEVLPKHHTSAGLTKIVPPIVLPRKSLAC